VTGPPEQEELLDTGPQRRPGLVLALALVAVAGLAVALAVHAQSSHTKHPRHVAAPAHRSRAPTPAATSRPPAAVPIRPPITDAVDVALSANRLYVVRLGSLTALDVPTHSVVANVRVPELAAFDSGPDYRAVLDRSAGRLWLVREAGVIPALAIEFDASTLARKATVHLLGTVQSATVLDGRVFLATEHGVRELSPGSTRARLVPGTGGFVGWVAADPLRDRLLVANAGFPTRLVAISPDGTVQRTASLPFGGVELAVTRGVIWAAGFGAAGARIARLDPSTLAPVGDATLATRLFPGAQFVAAGSSVVWVRGGVDNSDLWCMDGRTGRVSQRFPSVPGPVVSLGGPAPPNSRIAYAYVASSGVVSSLDLGACNG
jgi:hypothetical protein